MLHAAALRGKDDCMQLLLAKGVSPVALDAKGRSALQLASLYCRELAVRTLLRSGGWCLSLALSVC
jgi:ankyrin repeat protein